MRFRRRCLLFVPGDSERKIARAVELGVDARAVLTAWVAEGRPGTFRHAGEMVVAPMLTRARRIAGAGSGGR